MPREATWSTEWKEEKVNVFSYWNQNLRPRGPQWPPHIGTAPSPALVPGVGLRVSFPGSAGVPWLHLRQEDKSTAILEKDQGTPWAKQALQAKEQRPWGPESQKGVKNRLKRLTLSLLHWRVYLAAITQKAQLYICTLSVPVLSCRKFSCISFLSEQHSPFLTATLEPPAADQRNYQWLWDKPYLLL